MLQLQIHALDLAGRFPDCPMHEAQKWLSAEDEDCGQLFKMMANCRAVGHHLGELTSGNLEILKS